MLQEYHLCGRCVPFCVAGLTTVAILVGRDGPSLADSETQWYLSGATH